MGHWNRLGVLIPLALLFAGVGTQAPAQQGLDEVTIHTEKVAEGIYVLFGRGGNIGVSVGEDNVFMIDNQYAPLTDKIRAAVADLSDKPIQFVVNTHWHSDHVGGNEKLGEMGSVIVAHENVRKRMSTEQLMEVFDRKIEPSPRGALPVVTFTRDMTFHLNGDEIHVFHVEHAHTDGDAFIHFRKSNVIHMGDVFWEGLYPFIDTDAGGTIDGMIAAVEMVLTMIDDETTVITGHGPVSDKAGLEAYRDMLSAIRDRIAVLVDEGKSLEEVIASKPTEDSDDTWGSGFLKPEQFVEIIYRDLTGD